MDPLTQALQSLPHGPEFRFIDRLLFLEPGISGTAEYRVRGEEPLLRGHFPNAPIFPGVLVVEAAAQLAGVVAQSDPCHAPISGLKLAAIRAAKFNGSALPGQVITLQAQITGRLGTAVQAEVSGHLDTQKIFQGSVILGGDAPDQQA